MPNKRPVSGILGRSTPFAGIVRRSLGSVKSLLLRRIGKRRKGLIKRTGSNAEYHLTLRQIEKIIRASQCQRDRVLIEIMAFTGLRRAEIAALDVNDVLHDEKLLVIRVGKGSRQRIVPLPDFVLEDIHSLIGTRTNGAIFLNRYGRRLSCRQLNRIVANIGKTAGVGNPNPKYHNITCHLFRHSFARHWKDAQGSIESLSRILGHTSVKTTWDLYGTESLEDIRKNYETVITQFMKRR
ncbi:MAG: tyrosine-type recombinase/integrase [Candidatus Zixiibacteriota bacterium]